MTASSGEPTTETGRALLRLDMKPYGYDFAAQVAAIEAEATLSALGPVLAALADEDEIAHGEAWNPVASTLMGVCAYCNSEWPCHTQRAINRLLAALSEPKEVKPVNAPNRFVPAYLGNPHDHPIWQELADELDRAMTKFGPMASPHEGWAVIREELEPELWTHVVGNTGRSLEARHEALQVAAMAVRYILDLCVAPR